MFNSKLQFVLSFKFVIEEYHFESIFTIKIELAHNFNNSFETNTNIKLIHISYNLKTSKGFSNLNINFKTRIIIN